MQAVAKIGELAGIWIIVEPHETDQRTVLSFDLIQVIRLFAAAAYECIQECGSIH